MKTKKGGGNAPPSAMQLKFNATLHDGSAQNVHSFIRTLPVEALISHEDRQHGVARALLVRI